MLLVHMIMQKKEEISRRKFLQLEDVKQSIMSCLILTDFIILNVLIVLIMDFLLNLNKKEAEFWTK